MNNGETNNGLPNTEQKSAGGTERTAPTQRRRPVRALRPVRDASVTAAEPGTDNTADSRSAAGSQNNRRPVRALRPSHDGEGDSGVNGSIDRTRQISMPEQVPPDVTLTGEAAEMVVEKTGRKKRKN